MADTFPTDPHGAYTTRVAHHESAREAAARRSFRLSNLRAATFLAAAAAWVAFDVAEGTPEVLALSVGALLTAVFLAQVVVHRRVRRTERWEDALAAVAREGLLRLSREWEALHEALPAAERSLDEPGPEHAYARDLNVTGRASLIRLAGPVTSERGRAMLRSWLLEPGTPETAMERHGALRELAAQSGLRAEFTAVGRLDGPETLEGLDRFFAWAEGDSWTASRLGLRLAAWALPPILLAGIVGYFALDQPPWWILPAIVQFELLRRNARTMRETFTEAELGGPPLRALVPQLALLCEQDWKDRSLTSLSKRLGHGEGSGEAHRHLKRLSGLLDTVESRHNPLYAAVAAPLLMLDVHLCFALDRWRTAHGKVVRDWLEAMGEWEALSALAALAHDHPDWTDPTFVVDGTHVLSAKALGHPLLPPDECVRNDVSVGPPGTFLFVTGSNMSGKSTLLRALGANAVLAAAGAPVCAAALTLPPLRVQTSMRIEDSLAQGISLFMAELLRIKDIVEVADSVDGQGRPVLYLLDEILHGTNTAERRVAARAVVRHLLASGAIGAVSTHDLTLGDAPDLTRAAKAVHFREEVEQREGAEPGTRLTFDYELREGVATTRNALKLLEAVGLGALELEDEEGD